MCEVPLAEISLEPVEGQQNRRRRRRRRKRRGRRRRRRKMRGRRKRRRRRKRRGTGSGSPNPILTEYPKIPILSQRGRKEGGAVTEICSFPVFCSKAKCKQKTLKSSVNKKQRAVNVPLSLFSKVCLPLRFIMPSSCFVIIVLISNLMKHFLAKTGINWAGHASPIFLSLIIV